MKNIILVGSGKFVSELIQYLKDIIKLDRKIGKKTTISILGIVDNFETHNLKAIDGIKFLGNEDNISESNKNYFLIANGNAAFRKSAYERLQNKKRNIFTLIHPTAYIADNCSIGQGSIICPHTIVNSNSSIGKGTLINVFSSVGHHSNIGDYCILSPFCSLSGSSSLGDCSFLGTRATLFPNTNVGQFCKVDAHTYVKKDIENNTMVSLRGEYLSYKNRWKDL